MAGTCPAETVCTICEDDHRDEGWGCGVCSFRCHARCMRRWLQSSAAHTCPICRSAVLSQPLYTKEELLALLLVLCVAPQRGAVADLD